MEDSHYVNEGGGSRFIVLFLTKIGQRMGDLPNGAS